jgi:hypothetical protein
MAEIRSFRDLDVHKLGLTQRGVMRSSIFNPRSSAPILDYGGRK